jgi:ribonucleoside-diphosphate reductase alpha chain
VSCCGQYVGDSINEFYSAAKEAALLTKEGFGTSAFLGDIRPAGSPISNSQHKSTGSLPVFKQLIQVSNDVAQSVRRGATACYLPIDHDDFYSWIEFVNDNPDGANPGWCVSDDFIYRLNSGDEDAIERYQAAMQLKMIQGKGYWFFKDRANDDMPEVFEDSCLEIHASNLCVAPETVILTDKGHFTIAELENKTVHVYNGLEFTQTIVWKTSEDAELVQVKTSDGAELECTKQHNFYIADGYSGKSIKRSACELLPGDKLIKWDCPVRRS